MLFVFFTVVRSEFLSLLYHCHITIIPLFRLLYPPLPNLIPHSTLIPYPPPTQMLFVFVTQSVQFVSADVRDKLRERLSKL